MPTLDADSGNVLILCSIATVVEELQSNKFKLVLERELKSNLGAWDQSVQTPAADGSEFGKGMEVMLTGTRTSNEVGANYVITVVEYKLAESLVLSVVDIYRGGSATFTFTASEGNVLLRITSVIQLTSVFMRLFAVVLPCLVSSYDFTDDLASDIKTTLESDHPFGAVDVKDMTPLEEVKVEEVVHKAPVDVSPPVTHEESAPVKESAPVVVEEAAPAVKEEAAPIANEGPVSIAEEGRPRKQSKAAKKRANKKKKNKKKQAAAASGN